MLAVCLFLRGILHECRFDVENHNQKAKSISTNANQVPEKRAVILKVVNYTTK